MHKLQNSAGACRSIGAPSEVTPIDDPIRTIFRDLQRYHISPNRIRGQNFLLAENVRNTIIHYANLSGKDTVIEIGPGTGVLTWKLLTEAAEVTAIEIDETLVALLKERFGHFPNVKIIHGDALEIVPDLIDTLHGQSSPIKIVSNLPYSISSPLVMKLLDVAGKIQRIVLTIQKEVAVRLAAQPGHRERGWLSALTQFHFRVSVVSTIKPSAFVPAPEVRSAIVTLYPWNNPEPCDFNTFKTMASIIFRHRRKTVRNNLRGFFHGTLPEVDARILDVRPEVLTSTDICLLAETFKPLIGKDCHV